MNKQIFTVALLALLLVGLFSSAFVGVWQIKPSYIAYAATATFGNTNIETGDTSAADSTIIRGTGFTIPVSGTADNITVYFYVAAPTNVTPAIYYNQTTFLANATTQTCSLGGYNWVTFTFASPKPSLVAGHKYYLVCWGNNTIIMMRNSASGVDGVYDALGTYPTFPASLQTVSQTHLHSIYCSYSYTDAQYTITGDSSIPTYSGAENISPYRTTSGSSASTVITTVLGWMTTGINQIVEFIGNFTIGARTNVEKSITLNFSQANVTSTVPFTSVACFYVSGTVTFIGGHTVSNYAIDQNPSNNGGHFYGQANDAVIMFGSANSIVDGLDCQNITIYLSGSSNHTTVQNCVIHDVHVDMGGPACVAGGGGGYNTIQDNIIHDISGCAGIFAESTGNSYNTIERNFFYNLANHAIYFDWDSDSSGHSVIAYNYFNTSLGSNAAATQIKTSYNQIYNNTIANWLTVFSTYSEMNGYQANYNDFYNNTLENCTRGFNFGTSHNPCYETIGNKVHKNTFKNVTFPFLMSNFDNNALNNTRDTWIYSNTFVSCPNIFSNIYNSGTPTLIRNTRIYDNNFGGFAVESVIMTWFNTTCYNNTGMTGFKMLNMSVVGNGFTVPDGSGWQYLTGSSASVVWTPNSGNSRVDFSIDGVNQTTTTSPISITMSGNRVGIAYFSGALPPVVLVITYPQTTTYPSPTVPVQLSASGGTIDRIWYNCSYLDGTLVYPNTTYVTPTSITLGNGDYVFYANANNSVGEWDVELVYFSVSISASVDVSLTTPADGATITSFTVSFVYTPTVRGDLFYHSELWLNLSGIYQIAAYNSSIIANYTTNSITYIFNTNNSYIWNIKIFNSTTGVFASSNRIITIVVYVAEITRYQLTVVDKDLDLNAVDSYCTQQFLNGSTLFDYTEGDYTLIVGTVTIKTYYLNVLLNTTDFSMATYGNSTVTIYLNMKSLASGGYIAVNKSATITILNQTATLINATITASGTFTVVSAVTINATLVQLDGVNVTDWIFDAPPACIIANITSGDFSMSFVATLGEPYFAVTVFFVGVGASISLWFYRRIAKLRKRKVP